MSIKVLIKELRSSHPEFYKEPDAVARLARLQLPTSLQAYPAEKGSFSRIEPPFASKKVEEGVTEWSKY